MKKHNYPPWFWVLFSALAVQAQHQQTQSAMNNVDRLFFIENKGQWHADVLYLCRMGGLDAWITKQGVNYTFYQIEKPQHSSTPAVPMPAANHFPDEESENELILGHRVLVEFQGHNTAPLKEGKQKQEGYYNYFLGDDPDKHVTYVGLYKEAVVKSVYEGIDLRYYFHGGYLRYDFVVHPGAEPSQINFSLNGQFSDEIRGNQLVFTTRFGEVAMADLRTYQGNRTIASSFVKQGNTYSIAVADYDRSQPLIIDPYLYSTYLRGSSDDYCYALAVDGSGHAYVTGWTISANYNTTAGVFQASKKANSDVIITKVNSNGTALSYSTFLGGGSSDVGRGISVDAANNAYVTGYTESSKFPTSGTAFQGTNQGANDVFVTKLDAAGAALTYSTYIGGSGNDYGMAIAVDAGGNAYLAGYTSSTNYDHTAGAFQTSHGGGTYDVFVTKLNGTGSALAYSTYLGGSKIDMGLGIAVDGAGNTYVTGKTASDFDITAGAFQTAYGTGSYDAFVTKLNAAGNGLVYSTYVGGNKSDIAYGIAVDGGGNAFITGESNSKNYPTTAGAFQTTNGSLSSEDAFVTKLNAAGDALVYSTYIGGSTVDKAYGIAVDGSGNAFITGFTESANYDVTTNADQNTKGSKADAFVTKINSTGTALIYSSFLGGQANNNDDWGYGIAAHEEFIYIGGITLSTNFFTTPTAFATSGLGGREVFVTKVCPNVSKESILTSASGTDNQVVCIETPIVNITYLAPGATDATVDGLPDGVVGTFNGVTGVVTISGTPVEDGIYVYTVNVVGGVCGQPTTGVVSVKPMGGVEVCYNNIDDNCDGSTDDNNLVVDITADMPMPACHGTPVVLQANVNIPNEGYSLTYKWFRGKDLLVGETQQFLITDDKGDFKVVVQTLDCKAEGTFEVTRKPSPPQAKVINLSNTDNLCLAEGNKIFLRGNGGDNAPYLYRWYKDVINLPIGLERELKVTFPGDYYVQITNVHNCSSTSPPYTIIEVDCRLYEQQPGELSLYPNPTDGSQVFLSAQLDGDAPVTITLSTLLEQELLRLQAQPDGIWLQETIKLPAALANGTYLVRITDGNTVRMQQLVVQR